MELMLICNTRIVRYIGFSIIHTAMRPTLNSQNLLLFILYFIIDMTNEINKYIYLKNEKKKLKWNELICLLFDMQNTARFTKMDWWVMSDIVQPICAQSKVKWTQNCILYFCVSFVLTYYIICEWFYYFDFDILWRLVFWRVLRWGAIDGLFKLHLIYILLLL